MPDERGEVKSEDDATKTTPLHAHAEGRGSDIEGEIGGGTADEQDADTVEKTGGATAGAPSGEPSEPAPESDENAPEGGLGSKTDALGGGEPTEPGDRVPPDQLHPHGESGR
jgi:hypothetical protein